MIIGKKQIIALKLIKLKTQTMKTIRSSNNVIALIALMVLNVTLAKADWVTDHANNFKINIPYGWNTNSYSEGGDQVHDFTSPDENIFIQIRCLDNGGMAVTDLAALFEEGLIAEGATAMGQSNEELNGVPGVMGVYTMSYEETDMGIITFSVVNQNLGYLMFVVVPVDMFEQKADEADAVLNTFTLLSESSTYIEPGTDSREDLQTSGGLGGLRGSTSQQSPGSSGNTGSGQNFVKISGNSINGTFYFSKSDSYPLSSVKTVFVKGLDHQDNTILEIVFYRNKGTGTFIYENHNNNGEPGFVINSVNGQRIPGNLYNGSGKLIITEYREGGRIKGHVNSELNGHVIEASFDLPLGNPF